MMWISGFLSKQGSKAKVSLSRMKHLSPECFFTTDNNEDLDSSLTLKGVYSFSAQLLQFNGRLENFSTIRLCNFCLVGI